MTENPQKTQKTVKDLDIDLNVNRQDLITNFLLFPEPYVVDGLALMKAQAASLGFNIQIVKVVALICIKDNSLLLVRKHGLSAWILPGGKPEGQEIDQQTLTREIMEELGTGVKDVKFLANVQDKVAGQSDFYLDLYLYTGSLESEPTLNAELNGLLWYPIHSIQNDNLNLELAPSITNSILPMLQKIIK